MSIISARPFFKCQMCFRTSQENPARGWEKLILPEEHRPTCIGTQISTWPHFPKKNKSPIFFYFERASLVFSGHHWFWAGIIGKWCPLVQYVNFGRRARLYNPWRIHMGTLEDPMEKVRGVTKNCILGTIFWEKVDSFGTIVFLYDLFFWSE